MENLIDVFLLFGLFAFMIYTIGLAIIVISIPEDDEWRWRYRPEDKPKSNVYIRKLRWFIEQRKTKNLFGKTQMLVLFLISLPGITIGISLYIIFYVSVMAISTFINIGNKKVM